MVDLVSGGVTEHTWRSYRSLALAFILAIFFMYGILAIQFRSFGLPLLIMTTVLFAVTGVIVSMAALSAMGRILPEGMLRSDRFIVTIQSLVAVVGLTGIVVNDGIVLVEFAVGRIRQGTPRVEAICDAVSCRLRPIIMTSLTTIAGLLPMALAFPFFSRFWTSFSMCFVAGMVFSTIGTLLVMPALLDSYWSVQGWFGRKRKRRRELVDDSQGDPTADDDGDAVIIVE